MTAVTPAVAARLVEERLGRRVREAVRFPTGLANAVYDVRLADGTAVVLRCSRDPHVVRSAVRWSTRLRPLGVPLPALLDHGLEPPYVLLERLPGSDLGTVHDALGPTDLRRIAASVADAQRRVAELRAFPGYGHVARPEDPGLPSWRAVLEANVRRSAERGRANGTVEPADVARVELLLDRLGRQLDRVPPTPFLDDATTKNVIVAQGRVSGIVDVDQVCAGDPRLVVALTAVSLAAAGRPSLYADLLLEAMGGRRDALLDLYEAVFCLDLLSEMGVRFNRREPVPVDAVRQRRLGALLAARLDRGA